MQARTSRHSIVGRTPWTVFFGTFLAASMGSWAPSLAAQQPCDPSTLGDLDTTDAQDVVVVGDTAYVADGVDGLRVIDVSDPTNPDLLGTVNLTNARGVAVQGDYAYVADGADGLRVIDVGTPTMPTLEGTIDTPGFASGVAVSGMYAYVADFNTGLQVIDVGTDPTMPTIVGNINTSGDATRVEVSGNYAYLADFDSGLQVIDVGTNPTMPMIVGNLVTTDAGGVAVDGDLVYIADGADGLRVIDVSDKTMPMQVGAMDTPGSADDVYLEGPIAFVADGGMGLQLIDVSDPTMPMIVGDVDTPGSANGVFAAGTRAYVADRADGLQVIDVTTCVPCTPTILGTVDTGSARDVVTSGNLAYVVNSAGVGLTVIGVSDPTAPAVVGSVGIAGISTGVAVSGGYAYATVRSGKLEVINVLSAANPMIAGSVDTSGRAFGVAVEGAYAYVAIEDAGLQVVDVSDPTNPTIVGTVDTPGTALRVAVSGGVAYVADGAEGLQVIDVSDPLNPTLLGSVDTEDASGVAVWGSLAYVADGDPGLLVIDVSDPMSPMIIASLDTPGPALDVTVSGGVAYVADGSSGLHVIDVSIPTSPSTAGSVDTENASGVFVSDGVAYVADFNTGLRVIDVESCVTCRPFITGDSNTPGLAFGVAVSGSVAYVADFDSGLQVIDVSDPINPTIIGSVDTSFAQGVAVSGSVAYVADALSGLEVIDVSDPGDPTIIGSVDTPNSAFGVAVSGSVAYVADFDSGLQVIDVSDPVNPTIIGSVDTPGRAYGVAVSGSVAYVADETSGLQVIDVSDPINPTIIGSVDTSFAQGVAVSGSVAYVADGNSGLQVIDVSDPINPTIIGSVDTPDSAFGVAVSGSVAYVAGGFSGLQVIDVSDPMDPTIIGSVDTPRGALGVAVSGSVAYVADRESGLQVIDVSSCVIEPPCIPTISGSVDTGSARSVATSGGLAYVADQLSGLQVVDVSDPMDPMIIGTAGTPNISWGIAVSGSVAYVADRESGLQVIDVSDPINPTTVGSVDTPGIALGVAISGSLAFVADDTKGLQVIDVSDPMNPTIIGSRMTTRANGLAVSGNFAYVADLTSGLQVIDVSDPINPTIVGSVATPGIAHAVAISGSFAYVADNTSGLQVIDVSDPINPSIIGSVDTPEVALGVTVSGAIAYVAIDAAGLQVIDVSDPMLPMTLGAVATPTGAVGVAVSGSVAYVAATQSGLQVIDVSSCCVETVVPLVVAPDLGPLECDTTGGRFVEYAVTAEDDCGDPPSVVFDPPSGAFFSPGTTMVAYTATNSFGETLGTFMVTVEDTTDPMIMCPPMVTEPATSVDGALVTLPDPVITDICDPAPMFEYMANGMPVMSGDLFPMGPTMVTATATDAAGRTSSCTFEVLVTLMNDDCADALPILMGDTPFTNIGATTDSPWFITCQFDGQVYKDVWYEFTPTFNGEATISTCDQADFDTDIAVFIGNCDNLIKVACNDDNRGCDDYTSEVVFPVAAGTPYLIAVGCHGDSSAPGEGTLSIEVMPEDLQLPTIQNPGNFSADCTMPSGAFVMYTVTAMDNVDPDPDLVCTPASGSLFPMGPTMVTCIATDNSGNRQTAMFTVTVEDMTPPTFNPPASITVECNTTGGADVVLEGRFAATDACDPFVEISFSRGSGFFPLGTTPIMVTATDDAGWTTTKPVDIEVVDNGNPSILCPDPIVICATAAMPVVFDVIASDTCDALVGVTCDMNSGDMFPLGDTDVTCTATDASNNTMQCSFRVTLETDMPPELVDCPMDITVSTNDAMVAVDYTPPTAMDVCDGNEPAVTCDMPPGSMFPVGMTTKVTCSAMDSAGQPGSCDFDVIVKFNDDCADAVEIFDGMTPFTTIGATTDSPSDANCQFDGQTYNDVWFSYEATCTGVVTISTCGMADYDTDIAVFTGDCGALTLAGCNDDTGGCAGFTSEVLIPVAAGEELLIAVGGFADGVTGSGMIDISCDLPPMNDDCSMPMAVSCNSSTSFNNELATVAVDDPETCRFGGGLGVGTVWFEFTADDMTAFLETNNSLVSDTLLAVFEAGSCGAPVLLACSEDEGDGLLSELTLDTMVGTTYLVMVSSFSASSLGEIVLDITCPAPSGACCMMDGFCLDAIERECESLGGMWDPTDDCATNDCPQPPLNDDCDMPEVIASFPATVMFNNLVATSDVLPDAECRMLPFGGPYANAWYSLTGTGNTITVSTCNAGTTATDTSIAVYCRECMNLVCVAANDDDCDVTRPLRSTISFASEAGFTYLVTVGSASPAPGFQGDIQVDFSDDGAAATSTVECRPRGACCIGAMGLECVFVTEAECTLLGGDYLGDDVPCDTDVVVDGSFENGELSGDWTQLSTSGLPVICNEFTCGAGGSPDPHYDAFYWCWFGGVAGTPVDESISQVMTIPSAPDARVEFYLEIPLGSGNGADQMTVDIDGDVLFTVLESDMASFSSYTLVSLDASVYADGGAHTLTLSASTSGFDGAGGDAATSFFVDDVAVLVNTSGCGFPEIACQDMTAECNTTGGADNVAIDVTATDDMDPMPPEITCDMGMGDFFPLGDTVVQCMATDMDGNTASCSFTVTVVDKTPPVFAGPDTGTNPRPTMGSFITGLSFECSEMNGRKIVFDSPGATDICDPDVRVRCVAYDASAGMNVAASGHLYPLGETRVTCKATDDSGNVARKRFVIEVVDSPPTISCPADIVVESDAPIAVMYPAATAFDFCDTAPSVVSLPASGAMFSPGSPTTVECTATDFNSNMASCSFQVEVLPNAPPTLVCNDVLAFVPVGSPPTTTMVPVEYDLMATDNVDPDPDVSCSLQPGSLFPVGETMVTCMAMDDNGNMSAPCSFTVTVAVGFGDIDDPPGTVVLPFVEDPGGTPGDLDPVGFEVAGAGTGTASAEFPEPWRITSGEEHRVRFDAGRSARLMPTRGSGWAELSAAGTDGATSAMDSGEETTPPAEAAGIAWDFQHPEGEPLLCFEAGFLSAEEPGSAARNDFLSIDLSDGTTTVNLYHADTFSELRELDPETGLRATDLVTVTADLSVLFPDSSSGTGFTLTAQVGNGGDDTRPSRAELDGFRFHGGTRLRIAAGEDRISFVSACTPLIGSTWRAVVDTSWVPEAEGSGIAVHAFALDGMPHTAGQLLIDLESTRWFATSAPVLGPATLHAIAIPDDVALIGLKLHAQAAILGPQPRLTNAVELELRE